MNSLVSSENNRKSERRNELFLIKLRTQEGIINAKNTSRDVINMWDGLDFCTHLHNTAQTELQKSRTLIQNSKFNSSYSFDSIVQTHLFRRYGE